MKPIVRRSSVMIYKCDICGEMFEGEDAQQKYKLHTKSSHKEIDDDISVELIKEPETIQCVEGDIGNPEREETHKGILIGKDSYQTLDDLLGEIDKVPQELKTTTQYICSVCKARANKLGAEVQWTFNSVDEFDEHLWKDHNLVVKREPEFSIENTKTGEKLV